MLKIKKQIMLRLDLFLKRYKRKKKKINFDKAVFVLRKLRLPFTLIGGINHTNFMELTKFKPLNLAMINSIWDYEKGPVESALVFEKNLNKKKLNEN